MIRRFPNSLLKRTTYSLLFNNSLPACRLPHFPMVIVLRRFTTIREVPVPSMGDSITEGSLSEWKKEVGDYVHADDIVAVVDTDKVSVDINSPVGGAIVELKAQPGDNILVGDTLFSVDTDAVPSESQSKSVNKDDSAKGLKTPETNKVEKKEEESPSFLASSSSSSSAASSKTGIKENKTQEVTLNNSIQPPVQKVDITPPPPKVTNFGSERRIPMSRMRLRIAERLKSAQATAAMLTTFNECDMSNLIAMRSQMNEEFLARHGVKMGFVSAFLLASAQALQRFPEVNAYIEDTNIVYKDFADISVAVATPNGLLVPVIRGCEQKSWAQLEIELANLAKRARSNQIALEEMVGGTFTVSNGGVYGSMMGTPILNPPQSSILGMHATVKRAVVVGNEIVIRPMMYLALTYDHRIIDGREAVQFLCAIRDYIQEPRRMLLDL